MKCKVHKYKRITRKGNKHRVYKCILCPSFITEDLVIGHSCICWYCGQEFKMNIHSLLLKPHCGCKNDSNTNTAPGVKKSSSELENLKSDLMASLTRKFGS